MTDARAFRWDLVPHLTGPQLAVGRAVTALAAVSAPRLARAAAALARLLGAAPRIDLGPVGVVPRIELGRVLGAPPQALVILERDGRRAALQLDPVLAVALCGRVLGTPPEPAAPRALTPAEEGILALLVVTLLTAGEGGVRLAGIEQEPRRVEELFADPWIALVPATVTAGDVEGHVRLLLPESALLAAPPPAPAGLARVGALPCRAAVEAARGRVPGAALGALAPGDVVFLDGLALSPGGGPARLRAGRLAYPVTVAPGGRVTVTGPAAVGAPMPDAPDPTPVPSEEERLAALDIEVVAELGRVTLPGRTLATLAPGAVVELGRPLGGPIDLYAGGRLLARGELVDVDGEVGVRVTEVVG
jgi:type III secretion system YscQ/HrcQ family protein